MKITHLSLLLLTGLSSSTFAMNVYNKDGNTLDIYGRVEGKIASGQNSFAGSETRTDLGGRLGLYLTRDLDFLPDTKVVGRLEWQVRTEKNDNNTDESDLEARYSYIGLSHKTWGELIAGRTKNPLYQVIKMTDKYKNFTPNIYSYGITTIDDSYQFNRQDGTLQWNAKFYGNEIQLAWVAGNGHSDNESLDYGVMASYRNTLKFGDVKITPAIAASRYKRQDGVVTTDGRNQNDQIMAGLQLGYKDFEMAVTALRTSIARDNKSDNNYTGMDSLISYKFGKVKFLTGYSFLEEQDKDINEKEDWRVEAQLTLAKDTWLSLTYDKAFASKNEKINDDAFIVGLRYDF
ncbi:porin [Shigella boydii]|uniref:porin n=1 Tax=Shigella boydii TaxID=621 RepID=UPI0001F68E28|nr:porin [Shigella boydii]EFI7836323.1 porin [Escherichia coli]EFW55761.1 putative outer membrane protein [Shigella boydii ATCC 9905]EFZ4916381.1 porin [Shigella boydii]EHX1735370.1 porin [Shigella boydii]RIF74928.1 porin [Shigella boydii]